MSYESDLREYEREQAREDEHWLDEQIETAVATERARCLRIVEECCVAFRNSARDDMAEAREKGMIDAEMFHGHRAWSADELCQIIEKAIGEEMGR